MCVESDGDERNLNKDCNCDDMYSGYDNDLQNKINMRIDLDEYTCELYDSLNYGLTATDHFKPGQDLSFVLDLNDVDILRL